MLANLRHALVCTNKRTKKVHRTLFDHTYLYRRNSSSQVNSLCFSPSSKKTRLKLPNFLSDILLVTGKKLARISILSHTYTRASYENFFGALRARRQRSSSAPNQYPLIHIYIYTLARFPRRDASSVGRTRIRSILTRGNNAGCRVSPSARTDSTEGK